MNRKKGADWSDGENKKRGRRMGSVLAISVTFGATSPQRERPWQPVCAKRKREIYKKAQNRVRSGAKCGIL
ncbi:MAG: hypothetical protein ACLU9R_06815 [Faecalibacterium sp.]|nr:hypothetical protein [Faecalibacterium prausnitzii]